MKMIFAVCAAFSLCLQPVQAAYSSELMEDALLSILFPKINDAIQQHYGVQKKYDCPSIVKLEKEYSGTYLFTCSIELIKYEAPPGGDPKPPFEKVTVEFSNEEGEWTVQNVDVKPLPNNTVLKCRKPV